MGVVQMSEGSLTPISKNLLSEPAIVAGLAEKLVGDTPKVQWKHLAANYDRIRDLIESVIAGFDHFNSRVRNDGGFYLPNGPKVRQWNTANGKANFSADTVETHQTSGKDRLIMQTLRSHDQYNTTVYGMNDRYRGVSTARRIVFLNPEDMRTRNIKPLQRIDLHSHYGDEKRTAPNFQAIPYNIPAGSAATYFPEANTLVPINSQAKVSGTPTSKCVEISLTVA